MQSDDALLEEVQRETFAYFLHEVNERNGLVADCPRPVIGGVRHRFLRYAAPGAPLGPDEGTYSPWVVVASLPGLASHAPLRLSLRRIAPRGLRRRLARLTPFIAMADRAAGDGIG